MSKPAFQPAPRPRPHTSPEDASRLAEATGDLGFTRASSAPKDAETPIVADSVARAQAPKASFASEKQATLKFEVPDGVWVALRQEALNRRVTVKYLVLEALAAKGYSVDLAAVPEDGRRLR